MSFFRRLLGGDKPVQDPVCGMRIPASRASAFSEYEGRTYQFCCRACKKQFDQEPERFAGYTPAAT